MSRSKEKAADPGPVVPDLNLAAARPFGHSLEIPPNPLENYCTFLSPFAGLGVLLGEPLITWIFLFLLLSIAVNSPRKRTLLSPVSIALSSCVCFLGFGYYRLRQGAASLRTMN